MKTWMILICLCTIITPSMGYLRADLNRDGRVDCHDFAKFASEWLLEDTTGEMWNIDFVNARNKTNGDLLSFARPGIAIKSDGTEAADGVLRTETVIIASPVEYSTITGYTVQACDNNYIYASKGNTIYRSQDCENEFYGFFTFPACICSMFISSKGTLLVSLERISEENAGTVWRYNGTTFDKVIDHTILTPLAKVMNWDWTEAGDTLFVGEYRSSMSTNNARCVYASCDDGVTWVKIHNPDNVTDRHEHTLVAAMVNDIKTVYVWYGDAGSYALTKIVDNGMELWAASAVSIPYFASQPTAGVWLPQNDTIIWGTDGSGKATGIFNHVLNNDTFNFVQRVEIDSLSSSDGNLLHNFLSMKKIGDLYFAAGSKQSATIPGYSGIWVSQNSIDWVFLFDYDHTEIRLSGLGPDGNIYGCDTSGNSFYFDITKVFDLEGALIERASSNKQTGILTTSDYSTTVDAAYTEEHWHGLTSARWIGPDLEVESKAISFQGIKVPDMAVGTQAYCSFWVKGIAGDGTGASKGYNSACKFKVRLMTYSEDNQEETADYTHMVFFPYYDAWQKVVVPIKTAHIHTAGKSKMLCRAYAVGAIGMPITFDICIDGIAYEIANCPAEWQAYCSDRSADILSYTPEEFPEEFTDFFVFTSRFGSYEMGARGTGDEISYIYLRSYAVDNDNFIAVVYDTYDKKIKLINETAATNTVVASIAKPIYLHRGQPINIAVTRNGSSAVLFVWTGGIYQNASGSITNHEFVSSYWGCHPAGTQGGSLVFVKDVMYDNVQVDIKLLMQQIN